MKNLFREAWTLANKQNTRGSQDVKNKIADCLHYMQELAEEDKTKERTDFFLFDLSCIIQYKLKNETKEAAKIDFAKTVTFGQKEE